jgi:hypothetical protein
MEAAVLIVLCGTDTDRRGGTRRGGGGQQSKSKAPAALRGGGPGPGGQRPRRRLLPAGVRVAGSDRGAAVEGQPSRGRRPARAARGALKALPRMGRVPGGEEVSEPAQPVARLRRPPLQHAAALLRLARPLPRRHTGAEHCEAGWEQSTPPRLL